MSFIQCQKGSVGVLAVIVLALLGVVGAGMVKRTSTEASMASGYRDGVAAQYLAEAGAQWAIAQIRANPDFTATGTVSNLPNSGSYTVKVENIPASANKQIVSTGRLRGSSRTVVAVVTPASGGGNEIFNSTVASIGKLRITNPQIYGDVATNGLLEITTSTPDTVTGSAYSASTLYYAEGVVTQGFNPITNPISLDVDSMMPSLSMTGTSLPTTWTDGQWGGHTYALSGGSYYYNGSYDLNGHSYSIGPGQDVTIYVKGTFTLMSGSILAVNGGTLTVYAAGGINFNGGSIVGTNGAVSKLYATGSVNLSQNSSITGACLITALGDVGINGIFAPTTVIISKTYVKGSQNSRVAGIYSAGTIEMVGATATYDSSTMAAVGLAGATTPFRIVSFNSHI